MVIYFLVDCYLTHQHLTNRRRAENEAHLGQNVESLPGDQVDGMEIEPELQLHQNHQDNEPDNGDSDTRE